MPHQQAGHTPSSTVFDSPKASADLHSQRATQHELIREFILMSRIRTILWDNTVPTSLASRMRKARSAHIRKLIEIVYAKKNTCSILDLGGDKAYWDIIGIEYLKSRRASITLANLKFFNEHIESDGIFSFVGADARFLEKFTNKQFDICHSNSLIEHVGLWKDKKLVAEETIRVSSYYYVQTPNYWFPVEPHFMFPGFQFLPKPARIALIRKKKLGWIEKAENFADAAELVEGCDLLNVTEMRNLFPDARILRERIPPFTKSLIAIGGEQFSADIQPQAT